MSIGKKIKLLRKLIKGKLKVNVVNRRLLVFPYVNFLSATQIYLDFVHVYVTKITMIMMGYLYCD